MVHPLFSSQSEELSNTIIIKKSCTGSEMIVTITAIVKVTKCWKIQHYYGFSIYRILGGLRHF